MLFYSLHETLLLAAAAIIVDWIVGDPRWPTHPVIWIGQFIARLERALRPEGRELSPASLKKRGMLLTITTVAAAGVMTYGIILAASWIHPWLGYAASAWLISTTLAVKGLKDAAMLVYRPLAGGDLIQARKYVGYIVSRDTSAMGGKEAARAAIETVAENTVDAFLSPLLFALIGAAPLAMLYRSANTLDSMVGYKNERYAHFGWASARFDDVLNYMPARLCGWLITLAAAVTPGLSGKRAFRAVRHFAHLHPSPNSGIPESAAAGALGIELGGRNVYFGVENERARLGWPLRPLEPYDIVRTVRLLYAVSLFCCAGVIAVWLWLI
ncbi:cobalamin biosynthesis protein CobD [Paenibacillus rhizovicinus]|uniref:Cobalamin biosynthesis protein CobD n=1 Tax=Paenibacillus rhizovicinus TaxID=2704463 RepID=A0A6C0NUV4_9BACL|nr:adenosylcobinamide-phosphate synthase CbiB [Paenibacillus rhizovicinus]QHW29979.1 cobalamin biosynthesis protein CobD [Paenibacillus rhizovicinus]